MTNIWSGATPGAITDANDYEMGTIVLGLRTVTLNGIRVWSPANAVTRVNRRGHVWAMNGTLLATITMTDALPPGWSTHLLASPITLNPGDYRMISYECAGNFGAVLTAFDTTVVASDAGMAMPANSLVPIGNGRFNNALTAFPNTSFNTFYGVDADYSLVAEEDGTAPTLTSLALSADGLDVTAVLAASDPDGLSGATYSVDWGDGATSTGAGTSYSHSYSAGGVYAVLAGVTDSTGLAGYRAGAVEVAAAGAGLAADGVLDMLVSHAMRSGLFERVNGHEPSAAPGHGLSAAVWANSVGPVPAGSGLRSTSALVVFTVRLYAGAQSEPQDAIDPAMLSAVDALMGAYSGDFELGGRVQCIDLLGRTGTALTARAGYLQMADRVLRVYDITVPVIVNDVWEQVP